MRKKFHYQRSTNIIKLLIDSVTMAYVKSPNRPSSPRLVCKKQIHIPDYKSKKRFQFKFSIKFLLLTIGNSCEKVLLTHSSVGYLVKNLVMQDI